MSSIPVNPSEATKRRNPHIWLPNYHPITRLEPEPSKPAKRIRQSTKPLMNALETEYHAILCDRWTGFCVFPQSVRLKLGNGIWYKPDFCVHTGSCVQFYEVKGPKAFRGGFENLKVAASIYRQFGFALVWKDSDGQWCLQKVLP